MGWILVCKAMNASKHYAMWKSNTVQAIESGCL